MAALRLLPHRIADARSVSWHRWWTERDGNRTELSALLAGWDYASHTTVGISVDLDEEALLASTGLDSMDEPRDSCHGGLSAGSATVRRHQAAAGAPAWLDGRRLRSAPTRPSRGRRPAVRPSRARMHHTRAGISGCLPAGIANRFLRTLHLCGSKAIPVDSPPSLYASRNWA